MGVLMGAGERGEHEVARVRMTLGDLDLVAVLDGLADLGNVRIVDLRIDALREHVQTQRDQIHVAGALAVAQQAALHAVSAGQHGQLGGGHAHARRCAGAGGEHHGVTVVKMRGHVLHLIGEHVRRGHLDRGRQVDDHQVSGVGLMTPMTALHTSTAYSGSVPVNDSGLYS